MINHLEFFFHLLKQLSISISTIHLCKLIEKGGVGGGGNIYGHDLDTYGIFFILADFDVKIALGIYY